MFRRACRLFFFGAILLSGASALLTEYNIRTITPECSHAAISKLPILTKLQNHYSGADYLKQSYTSASGIDVFCIPTVSLVFPENPKSSIQEPYLLDTSTTYSAVENINNDELISRMQYEPDTITTSADEQSFNSIDTAETSSQQSIETTDDTLTTNIPAEQMLTKIQTKIKYVETILTKAIIEPYCIDGQIEGLQISGLDQILVAKDLLLKSGDIIRTVNGHSLNSKKRAYEIFKKARKLPTMEIELLRDGKSTRLLYCLK